MTRQVEPIPKLERPVKARKPVKRTKAGSAAALKRRATTLHSQYVRARDGRCVRCGRTDGQQQCAHVFSRRYQSTRTDELNAVCLDASCHRFLTENPFEHVVFFQGYLGLETFEALKAKAYDGVGVSFTADFWADEIRRLTALLAGVQ